MVSSKSSSKLDKTTEFGIVSDIDNDMDKQMYSEVSNMATETLTETNVAESVATSTEAIETNATSMSFTLLLVGIAIMLIGSTFPIIFTNAAGEADHSIAMALFWAMSAAIVRGVGYIPNLTVFKWLFSGWAVVVGLGIAFFLRFMGG